jgi:hypothetical protein
MHSKVDQEGAQLGTGNLDGASRARLGGYLSDSICRVRRARSWKVCIYCRDRA